MTPRSLQIVWTPSTLDDSDDIEGLGTSGRIVDILPIIQVLAKQMRPIEEEEEKDGVEITFLPHDCILFPLRDTHHLSRLNGFLASHSHAWNSDVLANKLARVEYVVPIGHDDLKGCEIRMVYVNREEAEAATEDGSGTWEAAEQVTEDNSEDVTLLNRRRVRRGHRSASIMGQVIVKKIEHLKVVVWWEWNGEESEVEGNEAEESKDGEDDDVVFVDG
jgi:hypothetical protein